MENTLEHHSAGLRKDALPFSETLAQSIANIAPTATPAVNLGFVFAASGGGTWFTYLVATIGLLLISVCISQFAKRSATPGSLYAYVSQALGPGAGFTVGWALILAYLTTGIAVIAGVGNYATDLLKSSGIGVSPYIVYALCAMGVFLIAYKDVSLSARVMLAIEAASVAFIFVVAVMAMSKKGFDASQLSLTGLTGNGLRTGLVLAIFSFVGFESATAMGGEARNPLKSVPRSVYLSTAISGTFFVLMSLIMVSAFKGGEYPAAPLLGLGTAAGIPVLGIICSLFAMVSLFACALACATAVSRIVMAMGRDGLIHISMGATHSKNETPHMAAAASAILMFIVPSIMSARGIAMGDVYGLNGTIATYGFLVAYICIAVGAIVYLSRIKQSSPLVTLAAVVGMGMMGIAVYGSVVPYQAAPYGWLPIAFAIYMAAGAVCWMLSRAGVKKAAAAPTYSEMGELEAA